MDDDPATGNGRPGLVRSNGLWRARLERTASRTETDRVLVLPCHKQQFLEVLASGLY